MQNIKVNSILIGSILLWASAFVGIKLALASYSPGSLALLRFIVASLCMAILYRYQSNDPVMPWKERILLMIVGMAGIGVYNICLNYGEMTVSAGIASFIIGLMPVITVLLSVLFLKERVSNGTWVGITLSLVGLALLAIGEAGEQGLTKGFLLILISSLVGSIQTITKKRLLNKYSSIRVISWVIWGGTLLLTLYLPDLIKEIQKADCQSTAVVIYMGIFPAALAYSAWTYVLKKVPAAKASISLYTLPFASTVLGFLWLGEQPSMLSLTGGGIALLGALIAHRFQGKMVLSFNKHVVA